MDLYNTSKTFKQFVNQLPGFYCLSTIDHKIALANDLFIKSLGFNNMDEAVDCKYSNLNCKAAEHHKTFELHDKLALSSSNKLTMLGYYQYSDQWSLVLYEKSIFYSDKKPSGIIFYGTDITNTHLVDYSRFLIKDTKNFHCHKKSFTYIVDNGSVNSYNLTKRQLECLFFLLRGKSSKDISKILNISYRTVETHIEIIKNKMNCDSKQQIIEKAFYSGMINFIPSSLIKNSNCF